MTEYSVSVGETQVDHDTSSAAAFIMRLIGELDGIVEVLSYWAFSVSNARVAFSGPGHFYASRRQLLLVWCSAFTCHLLVIKSGNADLAYRISLKRSDYHRENFPGSTASKQSTGLPSQCAGRSRVCINMLALYACLPQCLWPLLRILRRQFLPWVRVRD